MTNAIPGGVGGEAWEGYPALGEHGEEEEGEGAVAEAEFRGVNDELLFIK